MSVVRLQPTVARFLVWHRRPRSQVRHGQMGDLWHAHASDTPYKKASAPSTPSLMASLSPMHFASVSAPVPQKCSIVTLTWCFPSSDPNLFQYSLSRYRRTASLSDHMLRDAKSVTRTEPHVVTARLHRTHDPHNCALHIPLVRHHHIATWPCVPASSSSRSCSSSSVPSMAISAPRADTFASSEKAWPSASARSASSAAT
jgi:hypothetical protein